MARLRVNNVGDVTGGTNAITISSATANTCSWVSAPTNMPTVTAPDYLAVTVEPGASGEEIIWVTGYTAGATTAAIRRQPPEPSTGTAATHTSTGWVHTPTQHDFKSPATRAYSAATWS